MALTQQDVLDALMRVQLPNGESLVALDMVRAVTIEAGTVSFVIEAPSAEVAAQMEPVRQAAESAVARLDGVDRVRAALTAHGPAPKPKEPPSQNSMIRSRFYLPISTGLPIFPKV